MRISPELSSDTVQEMAEELHYLLQNKQVNCNTELQTKQPNTPVLTLRDVSYTYMPDTPLAHTALRHVSLKLQEQQCQGLLGATGSGKSTLLQHCNGLLPVQQGELDVLGRSMSAGRC